MKLGQKVLVRHFRSFYEVNYIVMAFYPTLGVKWPNGFYINCYYVEINLFQLLKINAYIWPNFDYLTVNNIYLCNFFSY